MSDEVREHLESWLGLNRDFLWKVMSHKEKVDAIFRDRSVSLEELAKVCDEVEGHLDELKEMLKKLYLVLYETQDLIKKAQEKRESGDKFEEDLKRKKEEAEHKAQEEAELRKKMERERAGAASKSATAPAPVKKAEPPPAKKAEPAQPPKEKAAPAASQDVKLDAARQYPPDKDMEEEVPDSGEMPTFELKVPERVGGLVAFLGLSEWFKGLKPEQQKEVVGVMISDGKMMPYDIVERDIQTLRPQFAPYCWKTANKLMRKGYDEIATGLLIKGLTVVTAKRDKEMLHIMYAKYFYRQRKVLKNAYDACINHCEKAIKSYMQDKETRPKPVAPFKLLTMIYEEKNDLDRIIQVCDRAIQLFQGSSDESKVLGFLRIKDILEKKEKAAKGQESKPEN
jgi:hypothetical protein